MKALTLRSGWKLTAALIAALAALAALGAARASAYVFWTDQSSLARANLDGSHPNQHLLSVGDTSGGLTDDGSHVYWVKAPSRQPDDTPNQDGAIMRANLDGSGVTQVVGGIAPVSVHVQGSQVYFVNWNASGTNTIGRTNLDGSGLNSSFIDVPAWHDSSDGGPGFIALGGGYVYWYDGNRIGRANLDGSNVNDRLITGTGGGLNLGFAVDSGHLYWALNYSFGQGSIARVGLDGSGMNKTFIDNLSQPETVDVFQGHIYWTQGAVSNRSIRRANLDGSGTVTLVNNAFSFDFALDGASGDSTAGGKAKCTVPSLAGTSLKKAKAKLRRAHCSLGKVSRKKAGGKPGRVLATHPSPGTKLPRGGKVAIVLSRH